MKRRKYDPDYIKMTCAASCKEVLASNTHPQRVNSGAMLKLTVSTRKFAANEKKQVPVTAVCSVTVCSTVASETPTNCFHWNGDQQNM